MKPLTLGFVCLHKNWCLAFVVLHFVMLLFFLCFWFCASFVLFRGGCLLFNAVILVAHISAAKYKVEVSLLGFMFLCLAHA